MERLTKRDEYGNADIIGVENTELSRNLNYKAFNCVTDALNRLAHYEDLEEQGRLVVLPCRVGDRLFRLSSGSEYEVYEFEVDRMFLFNGAISIFGHAVFPDGNIATPYECFDGKDVGTKLFLTREEAERALEGGNK